MARSPRIGRPLGTDRSRTAGWAGTGIPSEAGGTFTNTLSGLLEEGSRTLRALQCLHDLQTDEGCYEGRMNPAGNREAIGKLLYLGPGRAERVRA